MLKPLKTPAGVTELLAYGATVQQGNGQRGEGGASAHIANVLAS
jgi:hypothetical protein